MIPKEELRAWWWNGLLGNSAFMQKRKKKLFLKNLNGQA